jgi:hypothetical protein
MTVDIGAIRTGRKAIVVAGTAQRSIAMAEIGPRVVIMDDSGKKAIVTVGIGQKATVMADTGTSIQIIAIMPGAMHHIPSITDTAGITTGTHRATV